MHAHIFGSSVPFPKRAAEPLLAWCGISPRTYYDLFMLAQIVVQTNPHPYQTQLVYLWLAIGPVAVIIALLIFVQLWRIRRNRRKSRHPVR